MRLQLLSDPALAVVRCRRKEGPARRWGFRIAAIAFGLGLLWAIEGVCWLAGWGEPGRQDDPYVTFEGVRPLFVQNDKRQTYEIAPNRLNYFSPDAFPCQKPPRGFRIFVLGESTVEGEPYHSQTSFTTWLELNLKAADPDTQWDVVNCGGISYASYRLAPILEECLRYQPDLFILAIGHNEFLEDRTYAPVKATPAVVRDLHLACSQSRLYNVLRECYAESQPANVPTVLPTEVTARLDFKDGLKAYHHDDAWHAAIVNHYGQNLRRMLRQAAHAGVPVLLLQQPSNLEDCPPFKSEHRPGLSPQDLETFDRDVSLAREEYGSNLLKAVERLREAVRIDPDYAASHYELGQCLQDLKRTAEARQEFVAARDEDVCPLRMTTALSDTLCQVARETRTELIDLHSLLEHRSPSGILGNYWLVDHVHPSIPGHQAIADSLADVLAAGGLLHRQAGWERRRDAAYLAHSQSLDPMYYLKGERTLKALQGWAEGRVERERENPESERGAD